MLQLEIRLPLLPQMLAFQDAQGLVTRALRARPDPDYVAVRLAS